MGFIAGRDWKISANTLRTHFTEELSQNPFVYLGLQSCTGLEPHYPNLNSRFLSPLLGATTPKILSWSRKPRKSIRVLEKVKSRV